MLAIMSMMDGGLQRVFSIVGLLVTLFLDDTLEVVGQGVEVKRIRSYVWGWQDYENSWVAVPGPCGKTQNSV